MIAGGHTPDALPPREIDGHIDVEGRVSFFEVQPEVLAQQGGAIRVERNTLGAVSGAIGVLDRSAPAAGTPDAIHALERFATVVSVRVDLMRVAVDYLGAATITSGATYTTVDVTAAEQFRNAGEQLAGLE